MIVLPGNDDIMPLFFVIYGQIQSPFGCIAHPFIGIHYLASRTQMCCYCSLFANSMINFALIHGH